MKTTKRKANWSDPSTTAENEVLPRHFKWAWTSRSVAQALCALLVAQLTYFCTDMLGMSAATAGALLLASKLFDGVTDLIAGFIIDRTNTRFGKARPYELFLIFEWLLTIVLFSAPKMGTVATMVFVFVLYTLICSICTTFLTGSETVYLARSIRNGNNRVSVLSFNGVITMVGSIVFSILMPQLIAGIGSTKAGWTVISVSFAIPCIIIGMCRFIFIKEVVTENGSKNDQEKPEPIKLSTSIKTLAKNKYVFILAGMGLCMQIVYNMSSSINTYYFKYIIGDIGLMSLVSMCSFVTPLILIIFPALSRKIGPGNVLKLGAILMVAGYAVRILGGTFMGTFVAGSLLQTMGVLPGAMMMGIYLIDCMDYGEWKTGIRVEGAINSVSAFSAKLGSGIASGMVGLVMGLAGYDGDLSVQPASAINAIVALTNWIPLILAIVALILASMYKLDKELPQIRAELAERKKQA